jgi:hypothetical protein
MNVNSNEFKALKKTVGFFAIASIAATVFVYASLFIPTQVIIWAILIAMFATGFATGFWLMYEANLSRLNDEEKRNGE